MEWEVRHWERDPSSRWKAIAGAAAAALAGQVLFHSWAMALLGAAVILASTAELFLPVKFRLNERGASRRIGFSVSEILWEDVKRILPGRGGVRLSPLEKPSRLDEFRGVALRFSGNEEAVCAKISEFWKGDERFLAGPPESGGGGENHGGSGASDRKEEAGDSSDPVP